MTSSRIPLLLSVLLTLAVGCASPSTPTATSTAGSADPLAGTLVIQAAASLTDAFTDLAGRFEAAHPGVEVSLNLAGSQSLASQILQGVDADVFASASTDQMARVAEADLVAGSSDVFATNRLEIVVEAGNPFGIEDLEDLADPALVVVLPAPEVPAGALAASALAAAGVEVSPASLEPDVRAALSRVVLGEADAAIVYASDLQDADSAVEGVAVPASEDHLARYPIALLARSPNPAAGQAFIELVRSEEGRQVMAAHGFGGP